MNLCGYRLPRLNPEWEPCMHELLFHTSRYAGAAEHWLGEISGQAGFTLDGYRAQCLSPAQRRFAAALMSYPLTPDTARSLCWFVRQAARERLACADCDATHFVHCTRHARAGAPYRNADITPWDPFLHLASRLHLRAARQGKVIEVCFCSLAEWLDCSNPVIRANLQDALSHLGAHGFRLRDRVVASGNSDPSTGRCADTKLFS